MLGERSARSWRTRVLIFLLGGALVLGAMAAMVELGARWVLARKVGAWALDFPEKRDPRGPDPLLGWSASPEKSRKDKFGPGRHKIYNAKGMRATEVYPVAVPEGRYRVICVGDTALFGAGLGDEETIPAQMERASPSLETLNMGMGAYGVDQAVLWYERDGAVLDHDLTLLAFTEDAYDRMSTDAFLWVMPKPRFLLTEDGELKTDNVPVPSWGLRGYWRDFPRSTVSYKVIHRLLDQWRVQPGYDPFAVASALFARIRDEGSPHGPHTVLVHLPSTKHLHEPCPNGEGFCKKAGRAEVVTKLEAMADALGLPFIDVTPMFGDILDEGGVLDPYFQPSQQYSVEGSAAVARYLVEALTGTVPGFPGAERPRAE